MDASRFSMHCALTSLNCDRPVSCASRYSAQLRGEALPESDVDLLAAFDGTRRLSALDVVGIQLKLSSLLGCPVDLSEEGTLKPRVKTQVDSEAVRAF